jgi:hypothetical protein
MGALANAGGRIIAAAPFPRVHFGNKISEGAKFAVHNA